MLDGEGGVPSGSQTGKVPKRSRYIHEDSSTDDTLELGTLIGVLYLLLHWKKI